MKILATNEKGDPLIVRDENGEDYEIEVRSPIPKRMTIESVLPHIWAQVYKEHPPEDSPLRRVVHPGTYSCTGVDIVRPAPASALIQPASETVILAAHHLPSLEQRALEGQRYRSITRLGGEALADPVVLRRAEALRRLKEPEPLLDEEIQRDIKMLLDGLRRRPIL